MRRRSLQAAELYERAFRAGLEGDELRRRLIQDGSTLRLLGRGAEAVSALRRAEALQRSEAAAKLFLALALTSEGNPDLAVSRLIHLVLDRVDDPGVRDYQEALRRYANELNEWH